MAIEKIILGDDNLDFAKKAMPYVPNSTIDFVDNPSELITRVEQARLLSVQPYTMIISDYGYGSQWMNGIDLFRSLIERGSATEARKILWTGNADKEDIKKQARELGLEVLDKDQLGAIVGLSVSKAPLKRDGIAMIYLSHTGPVYNSIKQVVEMFSRKLTIELRTDLEPALMECRYGLVLDTTTLDRSDLHGKVAHDMKYMNLPEVPAVVCLKNTGTFLVDTVKAVAKFYEMQK